MPLKINFFFYLKTKTNRPEENFNWKAISGYLVTLLSGAMAWRMLSRKPDSFISPPQYRSPSHLIIPQPLSVYSS